MTSQMRRFFPLINLADRTSRRRGILFLERCHQLLKPGGALAFIIDEGVLNLPSAVDVRQFMLENFDLDAIVSLPETAFMPYATVNASILFLRKPHRGSVPKAGQTFFARAEKVGRKSNGDDDYIYDESGAGRLNSDFPDILDLYRAFRNAREVPTSELGYVAEVGATTDGSEGLRLDYRYHHPSRKHSRAQLSRAKSRLLQLADICQERNEIVIPSTELSDQIILYTGLGSH